MTQFIKCLFGFHIWGPSFFVVKYHKNNLAGYLTTCLACRKEAFSVGTDEV